MSGNVSLRTRVFGGAETPEKEEAMKIGMNLPVMEPGLDRAVLRDWITRIDAGPFSSIALGERIAYSNPEVITLVAATAALTERVRVVTTVIVLTMHDPVLMAKQLATIDVPSPSASESAEERKTTARSVRTSMPARTLSSQSGSPSCVGLGPARRSSTRSSPSGRRPFNPAARKSLRAPSDPLR